MWHEHPGSRALRWRDGRCGWRCLAGLLLDQLVAGALLGGAAGAAAGALTDEDQIDLGKPVWK